jgi:hypothetical protein
VDASFHAEISAGSVGAVIQDHQGNFLGAKCVYLSHVTSVVVVKALAMREGLFVASSMGYSSIQLEPDSTKTIKACMEEEVWWHEFAAVYADYVDLVSLIGTISLSFFFKGSKPCCS